MFFLHEKMVISFDLGRERIETKRQVGSDKKRNDLWVHLPKGTIIVIIIIEDDVCVCGAMRT